MDILLRKTIEKHGLKINPVIGNGLARPYIKTLPDYLSEVFKSAMATLPEELDFVYKGWRKLTPMEDFYNGINSSATKNIIDISTNYLYKVEFGFEYNGVEINRVIALPYVDRGGYLKLSDAHYCLTPVLSEYPVSPSPGEVFIRILRDKINVKKMYRNILINGVKTGVQVLHGRTYKLVHKVNEVIPIVLYGLLKYGLHGLLQRQFNTTPIVMFTDSSIPENIRENYTEYTTTGLKPSTLQVLNYQKHNVSVFIKTEDVTPTLEIYMGSLIYSLDMSPMYANNLIRVAKEGKPITTNFDYTHIDDESLFWLTLLGKIIFKNKFTLDRIQVDVLEHINILNGYLDSVVKERLLDIDIKVEDFYELLIWSMDNFNDLVMNQDVYSSKLDNRYIDSPYYILYTLIVGVNKSFLEIKRAHARNKISENEITRQFNKFLSTRKIYSIVKSSKMNLSITPVESDGDNILFKMSSVLEDQSRGAGVSRSKKNAFPFNARSIHAEDVIFGSGLHLLKKSPTPRWRVNMFIPVDLKKSKFIIGEEDRRMADKLEALLVNTFENNQILESEDIMEVDLD